MDVLADTAIFVDLLRNHQPALQWRANQPHLIVAISPIVWMEIVQGAPDKSKQQHAVKFLKQFHMAQTMNTDIEWAMQQLQTYHLSHNVGIMDCLIAAPAHRLQIPLLTHNVKHFSPMLGSLVQQPY